MLIYIYVWYNHNFIKLYLMSSFNWIHLPSGCWTKLYFFRLFTNCMRTNKFVLTCNTNNLSVYQCSWKSATNNIPIKYNTPLTVPEGGVVLNRKTYVTLEITHIPPITTALSICQHLVYLAKHIQGVYINGEETKIYLYSTYPCIHENWYWGIQSMTTFLSFLDLRI